MANKLNMAKIHAIIGLLEQDWSYRRIARELSIDRETVARYAKLWSNRSNPTIPTAGSGSPDNPNPAISSTGLGLADLVFSGTRAPGRTSHCEPFREIIEGKLEQNLSAQRIFQDLEADHDFAGSYSSVKRFVNRLGEKTPLPFRRMECDPGQEAQVDFGSGAWIIENGKKRRSHVLRVTLSCSRKSYDEAVFRQTTESFIRCVENAFWSFGGVTKTLVIDNLRAAVKNADWFDPELNPKVLEFARHYGIVILPTKPYTPRHKGKVESGIKYVKNNALKGRTFLSLSAENRFLADWERNVADTRIHGTTKKQVRKVFEEVEQPMLQPLPSEPFPFYHEGKRKVHRDAHVEVDKAYYSVPPEYLGREVWVRWDSHLVRIFNERFEQIAVHAKARPGKFSTNRSHLADKKISGVERGAQYLLSKAVRIGDDSGLWAKALLEARGIEGMRVLQGFVGLARKHPAYAINHASRVALRSNCFRLRDLRELIKRSTRQTDLEFTESHPIIRPLSEYQDLLTVAFKEKNKHEPATNTITQGTSPVRDDIYDGGQATRSGGQSTEP
jgi:transposase